MKVIIEAHTVNKVTGNLKALNWKEACRSWDHLREVKFPYLKSKRKTDLLIGVKYPELHFSIKNIWGKPLQLIPSFLTFLGRTFTGKSEKEGEDWYESYFTRAFVSSANGKLSNIDKEYRKFWEIEHASNNIRRKVMSKTTKPALMWQKEESAMIGQDVKLVFLG